jgi:plasmid stability protein
MPDLLVRDFDSDTYERLRKTAEAQGKSLAQTVRDMVTEKLKPSKQEAWAAIDRIRARIGKIPSDSTVDIREDRDNDEPYR